MQEQEQQQEQQQKKKRAVDIRTIRTKKAISRAVSEAMLTMGKDRISVKVVAEKANISRKTFYFYYKSVDEVLDKIQAEFIAQICEVIEDAALNMDENIPAKLFAKLNEIFYDKEDFYLKLCNFKDVDFEENMISILKNSILKAMEEKGASIENADIVLDFVLSGMLYCYSAWIKSGKKTPIEEVSKLLGDVIMHGTAK